MDRHILFLPWAAALVVLAFAALPALGYHMPQQVHGGGLTIYWGITAAETAEGQPEVVSKFEGSPKGMKHLVVAVYEDKTGKRINDAEIVAKVVRFGLFTVVEKPLNPIRVNGAVSYGNFFDLPSDRSHNITVDIWRPQVAKAVEMKFVYRPE